MNETERKQWVRASALVGVLYFVVGFAFAAFARWSLFSLTAVAWNRLAFLVSAVAFALHIGYEHFPLNHTVRLIAWHVSVAVALGAFLLALAANLHDLLAPSGYRPQMLVALVAWPLITAVPAFLVALIVAAVLNVMRLRT